MDVFLVDDQPIITYALEDILTKHFVGALRVDKASSCAQMLDRLAVNHYDLLVLDLSIAGPGYGLSLLRAVRNQAPDLHVMVFSGNASAFLALAVLNQGACAYVCKSSGTERVVGALLTIELGFPYCDPSVNLHCAQRHPWHSLSGIEQHVMLSLARGECLKVVATRSYRSYKTIAAHKYNSLNKLGLDSGAQLVSYLTAEGLDFLLNEPPPPAVPVFSECS